MLKQPIIEIISVGNELLMGKVLNTNAQWMAEKLTGLGCVVRRITTVQDDVNEISASIKEALSREPSWIMVSGGLGPTYDDKTLEGVAEALGRRLAVDEEALRMVKEKYQRMVEEGVFQKVELTPARIKMATLPEASMPLRNMVGTAPGVFIEVGGTGVVCLPGVPSELKDIFERTVISMIEGRTGKIYVRERFMEVTNVPESSLAPYLDVVLKENPGLYVKSHPRMREGGVLRLGIHIAYTGRSEEEAERIVDKVSRRLIELVKEAKGDARFSSH